MVFLVLYKKNTPGIYKSTIYLRFSGRQVNPRPRQSPSQALQYSVENNLKVYSITMDGTSTNLAAMKLFGCKLYDSEGDFDGKFQFSG